METTELISLREHFNRNHILLCFNGPTSRGLIEEIGNALKKALLNFEWVKRHVG